MSFNVYDYSNDTEALQAAEARIAELEQQLERQEKYYMGDRFKHQKLRTLAHAG